MNRKIFVFAVCLLLASFAVFASAQGSYGDINGDGQIRANDARLVLRYSADLDSLTDEQLVLADVNGDGVVRASDARKILRVAAELDSIDSITPATTEVPTTMPEESSTVTTTVPETTTILDGETTTTADFIVDIVTETQVYFETPDTPLSAKEVYARAKQYTVEVDACLGGDYMSIGSGFYISDDGKIVTNAHVIQNALSVSVKDADNNEYDVVSVIAYDIDLDLAIIKIDATTTPAQLCYECETAEKIYTLGSALGLLDTFSDGIVSNPSRTLESDYMDGTMPLIQITAPISSGNSGGPLIDEYGRVLGVNSYGYDEGQNLNFAIPVSYIDMLDTSDPVAMDKFIEKYTVIPDYVTSDSISLSDDAVKLQPNSTHIELVAFDYFSMNEYLFDAQVEDESVASVMWDPEAWISVSGIISTVTSQRMLYITGLGEGETDITITYGPKDAGISQTIHVKVTSKADVYYGGLEFYPDFGIVYGECPVDAGYNEFMAMYCLTYEKNGNEEEAIERYVRQLKKNFYLIEDESTDEDGNSVFSYSVALTGKTVSIITRDDAIVIGFTTF